MSVLRYSAKCNSIYRYLLHFGTTIPTVFPPVPGCHHVAALAILPLPVVASAVARRQAACRLLVHTVCQAGMKAGGRWLSGHEAAGCRRGQNRFPGAPAGVGAVPGQPPRGGRCRMAGRCGPSGLHVWPLPRFGSARAVARGWLGCRRGGVFSVWKRGIFVFCTIFHRHYLHLVVFMCYLCNR